MLKLIMRITSNQSGVAILYILMGIVLFAALTYTFIQSINSSNTSQLSEEEARVYAQDVLSYANRLSRGVQRVQARGICSESDVSFFLPSNTSLSAYKHTPEVDDTCKVFHENGGAITWLVAPNDVNDGSDWIFNSHHRVDGIGNSGLSELIAILPYIDENICRQINEILNVTSSNDPPPQDQGNAVFSKFKGSYSDGGTGIGDQPNVLSGHNTACFEASDINGSASHNTYHFYHVLIAR